MARSRLFRILRRAAQLAHDARRAGVSPEELRQRALEARAARGPARRDVLRGALGLSALAGLSLGAGCGGDDELLPDSGPGPDGGGDPDGGGGAPRIVIVGGGMAGIHCAYRLREAGHIATVYEAASRVGGRMWTLRDHPGFGAGQICELGGELIDTGHVTMHALAKELEIELDDLFADPPTNVETFYFGGEIIDEADIVAEFTPLAARMAATVTAAEADDDEFARVDAMSIPEWLADPDEGNAGPLISAILNAAYVGEYGLEVEEQSIFNLLYLIDYETPDPFRIFGDSDEVFHTHLGNDTFISRLAADLDAQIELDARLIAATRAGSAYRLTFQREGSTFDVDADHVVFALPFSVLRDVDLGGLELAKEKQTVIDEIGYGTNAKLMLGFDSKPWLEPPNFAAASLFTDNLVQATWDTSRGQDGTTGVLTNFVGGTRGVEMGEGTAEDRAAEVVPLLDEIYPGTAAEYTAGSAVRMHWPSYEFTKGSYACYRPGQWEFYGTEGTRDGNLHFCGEHTSLEAQGYMEGAAETGALVAAEILDDLKAAHPAGLRRVLAPKLLLPQASYHGDRAPRQRWMTRKRQLRAALRAAQRAARRG